MDADEADIEGLEAGQDDDEEEFLAELAELDDDELDALADEEEERLEFLEEDELGEVDGEPIADLEADERLGKLLRGA